MKEKNSHMTGHNLVREKGQRGHKGQVNCIRKKDGSSSGERDSSVL